MYSFTKSVTGKSIKLMTYTLFMPMKVNCSTERKVSPAIWYKYSFSWRTLRVRVSAFEFRIISAAPFMTKAATNSYTVVRKHSIRMYESS